MRFQFERNNPREVISNLNEICAKCFAECDTIGQIVNLCKFDSDNKRRKGKIINNQEIVFLCCNKTKTTKLFREKIDFLKYSISSFFEIHNKAVQHTSEVEQVNFARIAHNLRKINAQNIHQLYELVPQSILTENINNQLKIIEEHLVADPKKASKMFLRIAKNSANIRTEFAVFDKLSVENPNLSIREHKIYNIILNVYHPFEDEFFKYGNTLQIENFQKRLPVDYDTFRVALFHLFSNAVKYIKSNTVLNINFADNANQVQIVFSMISLYISKSEVEKIFIDKYSGENARKLHREGNGLGMGIIRKALNFNQATINVYPGKKEFNEKGADFGRNKFIITLKSD